ncbi:uncharacterized protein LOC127253052 [Andrographis paniculata]|uniref:uncharacterized protein LOC127253052 n=1 Tax=Andrographis paniculata TaxID=175694 RepID=UPI0021E8AB92|nr:uncharacterized protein LOC127253052 [Andrographis paniculata]XP_051133425.1 uncharacterized protein LOC127253052 [Andrographis paniculata]XP_051133426.1 uncharacterized protein LOC127253052 [Andrographis paniculata]XP_051133427.1 uncharacterized protein LOC127253052 [Andrographis paniculata]
MNAHRDRLSIDEDNQGKGEREPGGVLSLCLESSLSLSLISSTCSSSSRSKLDPEQGLILDARELGFKSSSNPKSITTSDEKYVLGCLELVRDYALRAEAWTHASSKARISPDTDMVRLAKECSPGNYSSGEWRNLAGMMNILKGQQIGSGSVDAKSQSTDSLDASESASSNIARFGQNPEKEHNVSMTLPVQHHRIVSVSSTNSNSSFSDLSSSSPYSPASAFQGMLQCTWSNGLIRHVFSVDDKQEVYMAELQKVESPDPDDKALDYVYSFYSRELHSDSRRQQQQLVAVMRVSTAISFCPDYSELRETQFLLSVSNDNTGQKKLQLSDRTYRKNQRLNWGSYKQSSFPKFLRSSVILEDSPWDPHPSEEDIQQPLQGVNHQLAAIIVKDISNNCRESDTSGGWGLRFLKKSKPVSAEKCPTTSINVVIPAGLHGGPKLAAGSGRGSGGPSSLVERWVSGGCCDCGGWDMGCPLTIMTAQLSEELFHTNSTTGQCKSVDLFTKGSKVDVPALRIVNIHDDLFYINFQSSLSSLQSFAIAAAIIHSRSHLLQV